MSIPCPLCDSEFQLVPAYHVHLREHFRDALSDHVILYPRSSGSSHHSGSQSQKRSDIDSFEPPQELQDGDPHSAAQAIRDWFLRLGNRDGNDTNSNVFNLGTATTPNHGRAAKSQRIDRDVADATESNKTLIATIAKLCLSNALQIRALRAIVLDNWQIPSNMTFATLMRAATKSFQDSADRMRAAGDQQNK
jgi:hypothetical protein